MWSVHCLGVEENHYLLQRPFGRFFNGSLELTFCLAHILPKLLLYQNGIFYFEFPNQAHPFQPPLLFFFNTFHFLIIFLDYPRLGDSFCTFLLSFSFLFNCWNSSILHGNQFVYPNLSYVLLP